ncbi:MAG: dihydrodipicolinate reductase [Pseudomonadota bacterium]|nr:hypothetical protein [Rubrivivax sp.]NLZ40111.1 dihydrodipicolinate reductase [Comamonadaceae bacterium]
MPWRVIQWASGSMGRTALRRIIDHPDLQLVGLHVYDPAKVGRDAGEIARRAPTGVRATDDIESILALDADVVIHTPRLSLPYERQNTDVARLLASGKNVISTAGFHYPQAHGEDWCAPLRAACMQGGSTLAGLGLNPGFIGERLALTMSGLCAQLESITTSEVVDASYMPSPAFVFDTMGFGADPARTDVTGGPLAGLYTALYRETLAFVAAALGTRLETVTPEHRLTLAPEDLRIAAGTIRRGRVAATRWCWHGRFADGRRMTHAILWTADPKLHGEAQEAHWKIDIRGRPNVHVSFSIDDPDPSAPVSRAAADATVAVALRAIADVCRAPPGFFAYWPSAAFRAGLAP